NRPVTREREALVTVDGEVRGIGMLAIAGVGHMAGGTAALTEVAPDVVWPLEPEAGVVETRLQQREKYTGDLELGAPPAEAGRQVAALEDPEGVGRYRDLPARQRKQLPQHAVGEITGRHLPQAPDPRGPVNRLAIRLDRREGLPVHRDLRGLHAV